MENIDNIFNKGQLSDDSIFLNLKSGGTQGTK